MLPRSKRPPLTTDDLMRRQELGAHKRQKRARDENEERSPGSDGSNSGESSQSEELSALEGDEDDQESMSDSPMQGEEDAIPSRLSFKPRQSAVTNENTGSPHVPSLPQTFVELGVSSSLIAAMNKMSIHTPTEIQIACIPPLLDGTCPSYSIFPLHAEDFDKVGIV